MGVQHPRDCNKMASVAVAAVTVEQSQPIVIDLRDLIAFWKNAYL